MITGSGHGLGNTGSGSSPGPGSGPGFNIIFWARALGALFLRSSWGALGRSWLLLGRSWGALGRSWAPLGRFLGVSWALLGASWLPNAAQEGPGLDFGGFWERPGKGWEVPRPYFSWFFRTFRYIMVLIVQ